MLRASHIVTSPSGLLSQIRVVLGADGIVDCDEALLFEATAKWLEHIPSEREHTCLSLLRLVRFPIMDSCLLSDVIKGHSLMVGAERTNLLLEAFEHHALRYRYSLGRNHLTQHSFSITAHSLTKPISLQPQPFSHPNLT
jgi:hypothetical protein